MTKRHSIRPSARPGVHSKVESERKGCGKSNQIRVQAVSPKGDKAEQLICTKVAAACLGISHQTLEKWRSQNRGPRFCKIGGKIVRYRKSDLDAFVEEAI